MLIHVIQRNDSLWNLSKQYGVPISHITEVNQINESDSLVVGQALVIPTLPAGQSYTVKPGDTLWTIAQRHGTTINDIVKANNIQNPALLQVGQILQIPSTPRPEIEVNGFLERFDEAAVNEIVEVANELTYVALFSYHITEQGQLVPLGDEEIIPVLIENNIAPMMVVANIQDEGFSRELIQQVLSSEEASLTLVANIANTMLEKGYRAVNIDFEYIQAESRELYNQFLRELTNQLHQFNLLVSTSLAPKYSADQPGILYQGHDYRAHGEIVDFVVVMTYEWGWTGGPPRAVAPLNEVKKVIDYALTEIPANKIMMGVPLYGYQWTLPFVQGTSRARALNSQQALALARENNAAIEYDQTAQSPYFRFYDENGKENVVWFEDARSLQAKFNLVKEYGLRGVSYWKLGIPAPINWYLLSENFTIIKLPPIATEEQQE